MIFNPAESRTPQRFTQNARDAVYKNLRPKPTATKKNPHHERLPSISRLEPLLNPVPSNDTSLTKVKSSSSIFSKFSRKSQESTNSRSSSSSNSNSSSNSPIQPQPHQQNNYSYFPDASASVSASDGYSIYSKGSSVSTNNSLFSSNSSTLSSISSTISSLYSSDFPKNDFSMDKFLPTSLANKQVILELSSLLDHISLYPLGNIGNEVFTELNTTLRNYGDHVNIRNDANSPEKLIDWNLNLLRVLLFISDDQLPNEYKDKDIFVRISEKSAVDNLTSELIKINNKTPKTGYKNQQFLNNVMKKTSLNSYSFDEGSNDLYLKVEKINVTADNDAEKFLKQLLDSELFKEFNIDTNYKRLVASISIQNSRNVLNSNQNYKLLALRNYFLNLIVATQTLFEFHYSELKGLIRISELSPNDKQVLWESIRERNFKKIKIFGAC